MGRFHISLKTNLYIYIICKDDSKQATKGEIGHRPAEPRHQCPANRQAGACVLH